MTAKAKFVMKTTQISIRAPLVTHQDPQSELIKRCYFADARFRATSPELKRLRSLRENVNLETPGAHLAAALNYYWLEAYSNPSDRNAACHLAGYRGVKYEAIESDEILSSDLNRISCGYDIDHPRFEDVFELTLALALRCMTIIGEYTKVKKTVLSIARAHYDMRVIPTGGGRAQFQISGLSLFEDHDEDLLGRTADLLAERVIMKTAKEGTVH